MRPAFILHVFAKQCKTRIPCYKSWVIMVEKEVLQNQRCQKAFTAASVIKHAKVTKKFGITKLNFSLWRNEMNS
jgi:hypothetical protein